jgi:hypothetical protein
VCQVLRHHGTSSPWHIVCSQQTREYPTLLNFCKWVAGIPGKAFNNNSAWKGSFMLFQSSERKHNESNVTGRMIRIPVILLFLITLLFCVACKPESNEPISTQPQQTPSQNNVSNSPVMYVYIDENPEVWAEKVFIDTINTLVNDGIIEFDFNDFRFSFNDEELQWLDEAAAHIYYAELDPLKGKVVMASCDYRGVFNVYDCYDLTYQNHSYPQYTPSYTNSSPLFSNSAPELFADTIAECDYLVLFGGFISRYDAEYFEDGSDRIGITTLVLVINANEKILLHIKALDEDLPEASSGSDQTFGTVDKDAAYSYIGSLLS